MAGNSGGRYVMKNGKRVLVQEPTKPFVKPTKSDKKTAKPAAQETVDE